MYFTSSLVALAISAAVVDAVPIPGQRFALPGRNRVLAQRPIRGGLRGRPGGVLTGFQADKQLVCQIKNKDELDLGEEVQDVEEDVKEEVDDAEDEVVEDVNGPAAVYWITNEPDGNFIMSASIGVDGQMTFADAFWAGGMGGHGITENPDDPDPLFSQAALRVGGDKLVAVNAGSNTISMFNIDAANPAMLSMAGGPVATGGEFPVSATIDRTTGNVCVLNAGEQNGVLCYTADERMGLRPIAGSLRSLGLNTTTPPAGPADTPSHILFSNDGRQLFAAIKGNPDAPGFIAAWDVAEDGSLSEEFVRNTPQGGGALPFGMTFVVGNDGPAILSTDPALGFSVFNFNGVQAQADTGVEIEGQGAACWVDFSRVTGNYYISDIVTSQVTEVSVDPETLEAAVVTQFPQGEDHSIIDLAIANVEGKDFLYVMSPGTLNVEVLEIVAPGETRPIQTFDIEAAAQQAGITVSTANLQGTNVFFQA